MFSYCQICGEQFNTAGCGCSRTRTWINGVPADQHFVQERPKQGWQCPGCQRYVSPYEKTCPSCEPPSYTIRYGSLQPDISWQHDWPRRPQNISVATLGDADES